MYYLQKNEIVTQIFGYDVRNRKLAEHIYKFFARQFTLIQGFFKKFLHVFISIKYTVIGQKLFKDPFFFSKAQL